MASAQSTEKAAAGCRLADKGPPNGGDSLALCGAVIPKMSNDETTATPGHLPGRHTPDQVAAHAPLTVSPVLAGVLESLRTKFGVRFEILNTNLQPVVPEVGGELARAVEDSPTVRTDVTAAVMTGRSRTIALGDTSYVLQSLRYPGRVRETAGLLGVPREPLVAGADAPEDAAERWVEILKTLIEADLEATDSVRVDRLQSRRTWAALRFLGQLSSINSVDELTRAVVHAAAVWFDVDPRVYCRDLGGDLVLHTHLPGVQIGPGGWRLDSHLVAGRSRPLRVVVNEHPDDLRWAAPELLLIPLSVASPQDWVLALGGVLPADAELVFGTLCQAIVPHLDRLIIRRRAAVRSRFEALVRRSVRSSERFAVEALRKLIDEIGAASGVLELYEGEQRRRIAMVGAAAQGPDAVPAEPVLAPDHFVVPMELRPGVQAVLDLTPPSGMVFTKESALVTREAAAVLRLWLAGSVQSSAAAPEKGSVDWVFLERVTEELDRAKRFDLSLSMLLLDLDPTQSVDDVTVSRVIGLVREELRCSDLLGPVGPGRIAVLLVHTDVRGVNSVMPRVRRRMEGGLRSVGVPGLRIGRAVLSDDCRTAAALVMQASHDVDAVVVN